MSNVKVSLILVLTVVVLAACTPAETTFNSPTKVSETTEAALEEAPASPTSTALPERPAGTESPSPTAVPTKLLLEVAPEVAPDAASKPTPDAEVFPVPQRPMPDPPTDPRSLELIEIAKNDLAERTGTSTDEIVLIDFQYLSWPDASLGCPEPGRMYAQVLVDGYLITLQAGMEFYNYHGGGSAESEPFLCENGIGTKIIVRPPNGLGDT